MTPRTDRPGPRYWVGSASRDHVAAGAAGGFAQLSHGRSEPLRRMRPGDGLVYYSGRESFGGTALCQRFTAIGTIAGEDVYRVEMAAGFHPWRRDVRFLAAQEAPIRPLIPHLTFLPDKTHWGFPFRRGHLEIPEADFRRIAAAMGVQDFEAAARPASPERSRHGHAD
jgi:hypothetical protein